MIRRSFRIGLRLGLLAGIGFAVSKLVTRPPDVTVAPAVPSEPWPRLPAVAQPPAPVTKTAGTKKAPVTAWVEPTGDVCPTSHPIKANLKSKIFHLPGMVNYHRTKPDRCYGDAAKAEVDGLRPAKR